MIPDLPTANSDTWNTPAAFLELVRAVMGGIDVDPASNDNAQAVVQAATFYTVETDGLAREWRGRVFLNPPYSDPAPFVAKLLSELDAGRTTEALALVNARTGSGMVPGSCGSGVALRAPAAREVLASGTARGQRRAHLECRVLRRAERAEVRACVPPARQRYRSRSRQP